MRLFFAENRFNRLWQEELAKQRNVTEQAKAVSAQAQASIDEALKKVNDAQEKLEKTQQQNWQYAPYGKNSKGAGKKGKGKKGQKPLCFEFMSNGGRCSWGNECTYRHLKKNDLSESEYKKMQE
ncbi:unnamed protein product, partial [Amoebophrya sp. A120]|eukprot:GSA120T00010987001.1